MKYKFGLVYTEFTRKFKFNNINLKNRVNVLAMGSSRVMQFRDNMFHDSFYNAGGIAQSIVDYKSFLDAIPDDKLPKVLIIGLDQWMFNSNYDSWLEVLPKEYWGNRKVLFENLNTKITALWSDVSSDKVTVPEVLKNKTQNNIGLNAILNGNGFRNDGSYCYMKDIHMLLENDTAYRDFGFRESMRRIREGCCRFNYGDTLNGLAVNELTNLLEYCKNRHFQVVAFLPPFADRVYEAMIISGKYGFLNELYPTLQHIFAQYPFEFYMYNTVHDCFSNDSETIDGFHGSESVYTKLLLDMLAQGSVLNHFADSCQLKQDLAKAVNRYTVYEY